MISKGQIWKAKDGKGRMVILSDNDKERWGVFNRLGWGAGCLDTPYGKDKEEMVHEDAFSTKEILEFFELTNETWKFDKYVLGPPEYVGTMPPRPPDLDYMPTRKDVEASPDDKPLKLGFACHMLNHGDEYSPTTGNMHDTDYIGKYEVPMGYTSIDVLPFLTGKPYDNLAWNWILALRPSCVRECRDGWVTLDACSNRVTIYIGKDNLIERISQEVSVGLIGVHHGHDLEMATNQKDYKQDTHVNSIFFNSEAVEKPTFSLKEDK